MSSLLNAPKYTAIISIAIDYERKRQTKKLSNKQPDKRTKIWKMEKQIDKKTQKKVSNLTTFFDRYKTKKKKGVSELESE